MNNEQFLMNDTDETHPENINEILHEAAESIYQECIYFNQNPKLRELCLKKYGANCYICKKNLKTIYGESIKYIIDIHHENESSVFKNECEVNIEDLKPVCPNCHTIIHMKKDPCYTIDEVKEMITK